MTRRRLMLLVPAAALAAAPFVVRPAPEPAALAADGADARGDEQAVRKATADYAAALTAGDADAVLAFWAPDADYADETGKLTRGREAIAVLFRRALPERKGVKAHAHVLALKFPRPDVAFEDGSIEFTQPDGGKESNRYAVVWVRSGGRWLISSARDLPSESAEPTHAAGRLKPFEWLVGEWEAADHAVKLECRWAPNRSFLLMDYAAKRDGQDLQVSQRLGWDPNEGRLRSWVFDSAGGFAEAVWERDGNRWVAASAGVLPEGGTGSATNVLEFVGTDSFVWRSTQREVDGQPVADTEVKFARVVEKEGRP